MKKRTLKRILWIISGFFVAAITGVLLLFLLVKWGVFGPLPGDKQLSDIRNATATLVYSSDDKLIGKIFSENRTNAHFEDIPTNLVHALIATEDARFYEHGGVDKRSMLRVIFKSILLGDESSGGGSTLTQQLAKNLYGRKNFSFLTLPVNKFKEIILAERLEDLYTKDQILEFYLNTVPFSENTYGIEAASTRFFNKKVSQLHTEESAVLVGMLKASTYYNPRLNPDHALKRRNVVLHQMHRYGYLPESEKDSLQALPLSLNYNNMASDSYAPYFMKHIEDQTRDLLDGQTNSNGKPYNLEQDGLRIYTTLNLDMQRYADKAMHAHLARLQKIFDRHWKDRKPWGAHQEIYKDQLSRSISYKILKKRKLSDDSLKFYLNKKHAVQVYAPQGDTVLQMSVRDSIEYYLKLLNCGFFAMQPQTGAILAWSGGLSHQFLPYDHVLAQRQAASTFKPIVYATALSQGIDPCEYISNERRVYQDYKNWAPRNYEDEYGGYYSMRGALKKSVNVAAVQTIFSAGINNVIAMARRLGISSELPDDPSIALGTGSVSLYDMVKAYAVFANDGERVPPYFISKIENSQGEILYEHKKTKQPEKVLEGDIAQLMNYMLQAVVNEGTGSKIRNVYGLHNDLAGKTGTAQNYTDGWFIGYNPHIVAGVWVGASSPLVHFRSGAYGSGSAMALPVFAQFFAQMDRNPDLKFYTHASFPELAPDLQSRMDCPDFKEENFFDSFLDIFSDKEGKKYKDEGESHEDTKEKKGFFKRIFGRKKDR